MTRDQLIGALRNLQRQKCGGYRQRSQREAVLRETIKYLREQKYETMEG